MWKLVLDHLRSDRLDSLQKNESPDVLHFGAQGTWAGSTGLPSSAFSFSAANFTTASLGKLPATARKSKCFILLYHSNVIQAVKGWTDTETCTWNDLHGSEDIRSQYCCNNCQYPKSIVFLEHLKNPHCKTLYKDYSLHCLDSLGICRLRTFWDSITDQHEKISRSTLELLRWRQ